LFAEARAVAPAIVFIDEIDSIGGTRQTSASAGEHEQTLNQLLVEMDGFEATTGVIVVGATNRPDLLDAALLRPGRFDRHVTVDLPDRSGREAVLALHALDKRFDTDVDLVAVAGLTRGFSGADLANVLNEAALLAARKGLERIPMALVDEAVDRTLIGISSRATILGPEERRMVAYHEAGHALVARALPGTAAPHKLTIVSRGPTLGHCSIPEAHDALLHTQSALVDHMAVALGGRVAEMLEFGQPVSGSAADLQRVGSISRRMVRELGMGHGLAPLDYPDGADSTSDETARVIDAEARRLAQEAEQRARTVLMSCRAELNQVASALLERESLSATDLDEILARGG
jgi:cell division protease FtsH